MFMFDAFGYKLGQDSVENIKLLLNSSQGSLRANLQTGRFLDEDAQNLYDSFSQYSSDKTEKNLKEFDKALKKCEEFPIIELPIEQLRIEVNNLLKSPHKATSNLKPK